MKMKCKCTAKLADGSVTKAKYRSTAVSAYR